MANTITELELRWKLKSARQESRILRSELQNWTSEHMSETFPERLAQLREGRMRKDARLLHLARAIQKGRPYSKVEPKTKHAPPLHNVIELTLKYRTYVFVPAKTQYRTHSASSSKFSEAEAEALLGWLSDAFDHLEKQIKSGAIIAHSRTCGAMTSLDIKKEKLRCQKWVNERIQ